MIVDPGDFLVDPPFLGGLGGLLGGLAGAVASARPRRRIGARRGRRGGRRGRGGKRCDRQLETVVEVAAGGARQPRGLARHAASRSPSERTQHTLGGGRPARPTRSRRPRPPSIASDQERRSDDRHRLARRATCTRPRFARTSTRSASAPSNSTRPTCPTAIALTTWTRPGGDWSAEWGIDGIDAARPARDVVAPPAAVTAPGRRDVAAGPHVRRRRVRRRRAGPVVVPRRGVGQRSRPRRGGLAQDVAAQGRERARLAGAAHVHDQQPGAGAPVPRRGSRGRSIYKGSRPRPRHGARRADRRRDRARAARPGPASRR